MVPFSLLYTRYHTKIHYRHSHIGILKLSVCDFSKQGLVFKIDQVYSSRELSLTIVTIFPTLEIGYHFSACEMLCSNTVKVARQNV